MADLHDIKNLVEDLGRSWSESRRKQEARLDALEKRANRPPSPGGGGGSESYEGHKSLETAFRALIAGDQAKADRAFGEYAAESKAMSAGIDPQGGYVVSPAISDTMTKVMLETAPFLRLARSVTMRHGASFEEVVDRNAASASWVSELQSRDDTNTPDLGKLTIELHELFAMPKVSQKLVDTADIDVVAWLSAKVAEAFANVEVAAYFAGNGVGKPRGFLTHTTAATGDAARSWGVLEHIPTGASGAFHTTKADPLIETVYSLKAQYKQGATWLMNRKTASVVRKLKEATSDNYIWQPGLVAGQPDMLLGHEVVLAEEMPDIAANSLSIAFGNFAKGYTVIRMPGVRMLTDPYTDKPNIRLACYERVGGGTSNFEAIKLVKFASS